MVESGGIFEEWWNLVESSRIWWNLVEYLTKWWNLVEFFTKWWNLVESLTEWWNLVDSTIQSKIPPEFGHEIVFRTRNNSTDTK